jgi:hypothetical protein
VNERKLGLSYFLKEIFIVAYIVFNYDHYIGRMVELGFTAKGLLFIALFLCVLAVLFMVAAIRLNSLRIFYGVLLFWSSVLVDSYMNITSTFLTYSSFIAMLDAREFAGEAWTQYSVPILTSVAVSSLLLIGISLKPRKKPPLPGWSLASSPLIMVLVVAGVVYQGGRGATGLPSPFTSLAYSSLAIYEASTNVIGDRKGIEIQRKDIRIGYDIVLIVDESILPNYLDINSEYGVRSGLKHVDRPVGIFNYGYAAAVTNCSAGSNLVLRYGGTRDNYLSAISTMPSLWQYGKNAGLTTVYIDAQRTGGGLHNGMPREELKDIDE